MAPGHLIAEKPGVYKELTAEGEAEFIAFYKAFSDVATMKGVGHTKSKAKFQTARAQLDTIIAECTDQQHLAASLAKHSAF